MTRIKRGSVAKKIGKKYQNLIKDLLVRILYFIGRQISNI